MMPMRRDAGREVILPDLRSSGFEHMATRDWVYHALLEAIVRGGLRPGAWLSETSLATQLEVSRTPLREALQRLQSDLLIERGQNGKLYVRGLSEKEARDLYAVRASLEELTVEEAAANMTVAKLATLEEILERMRSAVDRVEEVAEGGRDFHDVLLEIAENEITSWTLGQLKPHIDRYRFLSTRTSQERGMQAVREHEEIYESLRDGNVEAAKSCMRRHIEKGRETVLTALVASPETQGGEEE
ncbi:FCD domain-containing protein [Rubrobacter marinus]|uniref:FCD domain-containing protein n=2 Tax=Rubrobacter marinus TaxID=2653852 RepID=A0A6G8PWC9_9ACTN|nr:FCD domain-containing protein [Rubrobacter marinus]